jgi:hypothetical protein
MRSKTGKLQQSTRRFHTGEATYSESFIFSKWDEPGIRDMIQNANQRSVSEHESEGFHRGCAMSTGTERIERQPAAAKFNMPLCISAVQSAHRECMLPDSLCLRA